MPWRICRVDRGQYTVLDVGLDNAVARRRVPPPDEPVAVGDWVTLDALDPDRIGETSRSARRYSSEARWAQKGASGSLRALLT